MPPEDVQQGLCIAGPAHECRKGGLTPLQRLPLTLLRVCVCCPLRGLLQKAQKRCALQTDLLRGSSKEGDDGVNGGEVEGKRGGQRQAQLCTQQAGQLHSMRCMRQLLTSTRQVLRVSKSVLSHV